MTFVSIEKFVCDGCRRETEGTTDGAVSLPDTWIPVRESRPGFSIDERLPVRTEHVTTHFCSWPCLRFYAQHKEDSLTGQSQPDGARVTTAVDIAGGAISVKGTTA